MMENNPLDLIIIVFELRMTDFMIFDRGTTKLDNCKVTDPGYDNYNVFFVTINQGSFYEPLAILQTISFLHKKKKKYITFSKVLGSVLEDAGVFKDVSLITVIL